MLATFFVERNLCLTTLMLRLYEYLMEPRRLRSLVRDTTGKLHQLEKQEVVLRVFEEAPVAVLFTVMQASAQCKKPSCAASGSTHVLLTSLLSVLLSAQTPEK